MSAPPTELTTEHKQFLHGLFTTALEGGIGYWSACSTYRWATDEDGRTDDLDGFHAVIHPTEDGWGVYGDPKGTVGDCEQDRQPLTIDLEVMHTGARLFSWFVQGFVTGSGKPVPLDEVTPFPPGHYYWQYIESYITLGQSGDYDAGVADCVVQFGLFGEVVYG